jgi:hypothetical protein
MNHFADFGKMFFPAKPAKIDSTGNKEDAAGVAVFLAAARINKYGDNSYT